MKKVLFVPFSIALGVLAGLLSKPVVDQVWGLIDDEEPPASGDRLASWSKILAAAAIQGAIFKMSRAAVDRAFRIFFHGVTGSWPGDTRPDPK